MKKPLRAPILKNNLYRNCIELAQRSKSQKMRFGSIIIRGGRIIGEGWNRRPETNATIKMGYANHAEIEALNDALRHGWKTGGSCLYVAGYFVSSGLLYLCKFPSYTCQYCAKWLTEYEIAEVLVPGRGGWLGLSGGEAYTSARHIHNTIGRNQSTIATRADLLDGKVTLRDWEDRGSCLG